MNAQPFSSVRNIKLIYPFHENVERRLRLSDKTLTLLKQEDIMLNSMTQIGEKWDCLGLSRGDF